MPPQHTHVRRIDRSCARRGVTEQMDPFVATIVKQGVVVGLGVGALAFMVFYMIKMMSLQHALTLNLVPPPLQ